MTTLAARSQVIEQQALIATAKFNVMTTLR